MGRCAERFVHSLFGAVHVVRDVEESLNGWADVGEARGECEEFVAAEGTVSLFTICQGILISSDDSGIAAATSTA